jgi:hypothetical protein
MVGLSPAIGCNLLLFPFVKLPKTTRKNENYNLPKALARDGIVRRRTRSLRKADANRISNTEEYL